MAPGAMRTSTSVRHVVSGRNDERRGGILAVRECRPPDSDRRNGQTFELGATYVFPEAGWRGISSFTWSMPKPPYPGYDYDDTAIIDNVVFTPVPEPVTLELLLAGIAAVAVRVRR